MDALVIGQDDGYHFGLPNVVKARLESAINSAKLSDTVVLTRGADEVAQTMLGRFANALKPPVRIYVEYSAADAPHIVMPFMSHSVATTVTEKIQLLHATEVATEQQADFILFVHIGRQSSTPGKLQAAAGRLRHLLDSGRSVALVDLAENFYASQTLLPYAIEAGISIDRLTAYAGWNTASNAIGTAVTQAALYTGRQKEGASSLRLHYDNLTFTTARVLDDWHYLKSIQPQIDKKLLRAGIDPYHLQSHRPNTEALIRRAMNERSRLLLRQALNRPFRWPGFEQPFLINAIDPVIQLPWDRTFEIKLDANLELIQLKSP